MAPTCSLVLRIINVVAEVEADYVAIFKLVLGGHDYGCLALLLGDIFSN